MPPSRNHSNYPLNTELSAPRYDNRCKIQVVRNFSRYNKYNLGAEMRAKSRDIVKFVIKANSSRNKLPLLYELREHIEELKDLIRISKVSEMPVCVARLGLCDKVKYVRCLVC